MKICEEPSGRGKSKRKDNEARVNLVCLRRRRDAFRSWRGKTGSEKGKVVVGKVGKGQAVKGQACRFPLGNQTFFKGQQGAAGEVPAGE